jgi:phosphoribosyl-ATP pyrophosphohydrolase
VRGLLQLRNHGLHRPEPAVRDSDGVTVSDTLLEGVAQMDAEGVVDLLRMLGPLSVEEVLARVEPAGPACHTGAVTCFGGATGDELSTLAATLSSRAADAPVGSYTAKLLGNRNLRLKKLGEESAELVVALADGDQARTLEEAADVMYHVLVALQANGLTLDGVREVLASRRR